MLRAKTATAEALLLDMAEVVGALCPLSLRCTGVGDVVITEEQYIISVGVLATTCYTMYSKKGTSYVSNCSTSHDI